jgi:hypothetical protein
VQHDDDLLLVASGLCGIGHNQRRGQKLLFLQRMRMHPVSTGSASREIEAAFCARTDHWRWCIRHSVTRPRRGKSVPVDKRRLCCFVAQGNVKRAPCRQPDPQRAIRLSEAKHLGGTAVYFNGPSHDRKLPVGR